MKFEETVAVNASPEAIWSILSDIDNAAENISAIEKVEVLEKPTDGLVGLKWIETRTMFGKTATETMWITEAVENSHYLTRAENHGAIYISKMYITEEGGTTHVGMSFDGQPQTFMAKLMMGMMGWMFKKATKKALMKDLVDIKALAEQKKS
jgi:carbon monoxide dehydrogenase subunit G